MSEATRRIQRASGTLPVKTPAEAAHHRAKVDVAYKESVNTPSGDAPRKVRPKIVVGYRVGKLTVTEPTQERRSRYMVWRCACECGGEILLDTRYLQRGVVTDCGCAGSIGPEARAERRRLAARPAIRAGFQIGRLTVTEASGMLRGGYPVWRCACECGGEILLDTRQLRRGVMTDCGCEGKPGVGIRDLRNMRFGKLTVLSFTGQTERNGAIWLCQCDCGGQVRAARGQLTSGYVKSCGCLSRPPLKDYIGKRFGRLTVTGYAGKRDGQHMWACRCDCGGTTQVRQTYLQSGKTQSCGCLQANVIKETLKLVDGTAVALLEYFRNHLSVHNKSGYNGVYRNKRLGKWTAQITFKGKTKNLGTYEKLEDAVRARWIAQQEVELFLEEYYTGHPEKKPKNKQEKKPKT